MSVEVKLPELGESVTEGTVTRWLKSVGDHVDVDEPLLEVSTDKVDTEVPSPVAGTLQQILAAEDDTVAVGATLAIIGDSAPAAPATAPEPTPTPAAAPTPEPTPAHTAETPTAGPIETATPAAAGTPITLPELGESVTEGTVTRWLKSVGDHVDVDEPLLEVSTDKVDTEVPSPVAGTLQQILAAEDDTVAVGATLAIIGDSAPAAPATAPEPTPTPAAAPTPEPTPAHTAETPTAAADSPSPNTPSAPDASTAGPARRTTPGHAAPTAPATTRYVTPIVRKLAHDKNIDLSTLTGTGVGGRIRREDVLHAAAVRAEAERTAAEATASAPAKPEPSPLRGTTVPFTRLRKSIATAMVTSLQTMAQLTTVVEVDVTRVAALRQAKKQEFLAATGNKLSFLPFFAYAALEMLPAYPMVNASVDADGSSIIYHGTENLSVAVDTDRGLYAPVIKDAGSLTIAQLAARIADLAARTRDNRLVPDDMSGGTFTLTNTGSRGALFDTPIVALPQSAILGTGTVVKRPAVVNVDGQDAVVVRSFVYLALSYDHRIVDGADAARYLSAVKARLEDGEFEAALGI